MSKRLTFVVALAAISLFSAEDAPAQPYMTVTSSNETGGPTIVQLAQSIVDESAQYTLDTTTVSNVINASGNPLSNLRGMGTFQNGTVAPGSPLPAANNVSPAVTYSGGIGMPQGVCLCTGTVTDNDPAVPPSGPDRGRGVQGPNNGEGDTNPGEIFVQLLNPSAIDQDFNQHVFNNAIPAGSSDATVLQFQITLTAPGYLRLQYVFGSDEYPFYIRALYNDSFAVLIKKDSCNSTGYQNIAVFKEPGNPNPKPFTLQDIEACGPMVFRKNQLAPAPSIFVDPVSPHAIDDTPGEEPHEYDTSVLYYDHEFGGFTKPLTSETPTVLSKGKYTIKIVIHDVGDANVDAGLFIAENGLKLFSFRSCDFNRDGCVDDADFDIWASNYNMTPAEFPDGDANADCVVNMLDYLLWAQNVGQSGNADYRSDFDRDGDVDYTDYQIWAMNYGLHHCATRADGDADGDGDVDIADYVIIAMFEYGLTSCGCECGEGEELARGGGGSLAELQEMLPKNADVNEDGELDAEEIAAIEAIIDKWRGDRVVEEAPPVPEYTEEELRAWGKENGLEIPE